MFFYSWQVSKQWDAGELWNEIWGQEQKKELCNLTKLSGLSYNLKFQLNYNYVNFQHNMKYCHDQRQWLLQ